jgi:pyruvate-ferredoxin/flavodoxin oxidoreductase
MVMFRPFPEDHVTKVLKGKKGVVVLERIDQPLAVELPLVREIRSAVGKAVENGRDPKNLAYPGLAAYTDLADLPKLYSASFGMGSRDLQPEGIIGAVENMLPGGGEQEVSSTSPSTSCGTRPARRRRRSTRRPSPRPTPTWPTSRCGAPRTRT